MHQSIHSENVQISWKNKCRFFARGQNVLYNLNIETLAPSKCKLPFYKKWNKKIGYFFSREIFTWQLGSIIAISYQIFKSGGSHFFNVLNLQGYVYK